LKPGDKLDESKLAEKYGTSRTPVREALRQLSSNGLIEIRPHKGAIVTKLSIRDLVEHYEVMAELEGACGRAAAKACLKADIEAIIQANEACRAMAMRNDIASYQEANEAFHEAIYMASHNSYLIRLTKNLRNRVAVYRRMQLEQINRPCISVQEHDRIIQAIQQGKPDETDRLLQMHILDNGAELRRLIAMLANDPEETGDGGKPLGDELAPRRLAAASKL
jgi:DNA-binding GntR family transcriptional regulator